jgi:hypothetical protein
MTYQVKHAHLACIRAQSPAHTAPPHKKKKKKKKEASLWLNTCNPSYSVGRDQEDHGSKPARANSFFETLSRKNSSQKKGLVEWLKV